MHVLAEGGRHAWFVEDGLESSFLVDLLIKFGGPHALFVKDHENLTPAELAIKYHRFQLAEYLLQCMQKYHQVSAPANLGRSLPKTGQDLFGITLLIKRTLECDVANVSDELDFEPDVNATAYGYGSQPALHLAC